MKVAITGSTGMIGLALTKFLISNNDEVIMFVRENSKKLDKIPVSDKITIVKCDLSNLEKFNTVGLTCDYFIHLGWDKTIGEGRNDVYLQNLNIKYTLDAVKLANKMNAKKFIGIGSQAEYGLHNEPLSINTSCNPITGYGIAKYAAGKLSYIYASQLNMEFNWIRILSVYGENDNPNTLISYILSCIKNKVDANVSPCEQVWDYIEANDAAKIILDIAKFGKNGITYPLGSGKPKILKEYLEDLKRKYNSDININYGARAYNENQVMYLVADMSYLDELTKGDKNDN